MVSEAKISIIAAARSIFPAYADRLAPRAVVNANDRFANFNDPERDCYAASLVLGVDCFAVAQADRPPP